MKKLLLLVTMVAISFTSYAQKFGIKAGLNISKIKVNSALTSGNTDERTSFYIGGLVSFKMSKKFHLQPEILFSSEGAKDYEVSFVNVPLIFKYFIVRGLNLQAGPQIGFIVDAETGTDSLKTLSLGINIGLGYELNNGLFFETRYNHGLSNFVKDGVGPEFYSRPFQIGIGYQF